MQMSEELDKLKNLQEVLAEKYDIESKVEELPTTIVSSTESLERSKKEYIEKNKQYEEKKANISQIKIDLEEVQRKREEAEKGMDAVTTNRDYEILAKQIDESQKIEDDKRKELQKEEKELAELSDLLTSEEAFISDTQKDVDESKEKLEKEIQELKEKIEALTVQEQAIAEGIDAETIIKFQRIIRRNRKGIVAVKGNVCDGCHMVLPAQFANEIRHGDKIMFCPYCSRILFSEIGVDDSQEYYSMESSESIDSEDEDLLDEDLIEDEFDEETDDGDESLSKSMDYDN